MKTSSVMNIDEFQVMRFKIQKVISDKCRQRLHSTNTGNMF